MFRDVREVAGEVVEWFRDLPDLPAGQSSALVPRIQVRPLTTTRNSSSGHLTLL